MYIANFTNDYDKITDYDNVKDYDNMTLTNSTNNDNNIEIIIHFFYNNHVWTITYVFNIPHGLHPN